MDGNNNQCRKRKIFDSRDNASSRDQETSEKRVTSMSGDSTDSVKQEDVRNKDSKNDTEVIEAGQENISKGCEEKGILSDKPDLSNSNTDSDFSDFWDFDYPEASDEERPRTFIVKRIRLAKRANTRQESTDNESLPDVPDSTDHCYAANQEELPEVQKYLADCLRDDEKQE